jgi:3-dehydroquinate synthase
MTSFTARVGSETYPVVISEAALTQLKDYTKNFSRTSVVIIADGYFSRSDCSDYPELLCLFDSYETLFVDGGVESKSLETYARVLGWMVSKSLPRDAIVIAIGGGVVGDLSAFVASTYHRGVRLVHVPTTTTSMIDSSIGGKTGLNFGQQVNTIGTYHNPIAVFMDVRFLLTLNSRDYNAGLCEAIKMAITSSSMMFYKLMDNAPSYHSACRSFGDLIELVAWSVKTKLSYVCDDAKEQNVRLILNYGHTFGQSIETHYGLFQDYFRHGEAVSLGIVAACNAAELVYDTSDASRVRRLSMELLAAHDLPLLIPSGLPVPPPSSQSLVSNLANDKKRLSSGNRFVLVPSLGMAEVSFIDDNNLLLKSFQGILNKQ